MEHNSPSGVPQPKLVIPVAPENVITTAATSPPDNPFDPSRLRLSQDFGGKIGVKKLLNTVRTCKPVNQWFFRTHPDATYRLPTYVVELKDERETYLVNPKLWPLLPGDTIPKLLITGINRQDVLFLWPIRLPN
jgi:hypothetical protein